MKTNTKTSMSGKTKVDGNKCLNTDSDMSSDVSVDVNDVFDQLFTEYHKLREELRVYEEFKRFVDRLMTRMRSLLSDTEVETLDQLDSRLKTSANSSDSERQSLIVCEVKSEESSDVIDNGLQPIPKRGRGRPPKVVNDCKPKVNGQHLNRGKIAKKKTKNKKKEVISTPAVQQRTEMICEYCQKRLSSQKSYSDHQFQYHGIGRTRRTHYQCEWPGCESVYFRKSRYQEHLNGHRGVVYQCSVNGCTKAYKTTQGLRHHEEGSHNDRPFKCTVKGCPKSFPSAFKRTTHMRLHRARERTAVCDVPGCEFRTFDKYMLARHKIVHSADRPFQCTVEGCDKAFKIKADLTQHTTNIHGSGQTYRCDADGCDLTFRCRLTRDRHKQRVHSSHMFGCEWPGCEYQTKVKENLKKHAIVHKTDNNYSCPWPGCTRAFKSPKYLREHIRVHQSDRKYGCHWPGCQYRCYHLSNVKKHCIQVHKMNKDMVNHQNYTVDQEQPNNRRVELANS